MNTDPSATSSRTVRLSEVFALVLLWNGGYKGARVLNTLYALKLGASPFEIGLLLATYGLFALVLALHAGRFTDRYGVRVPVVGGIIACVLGILLPFFWPTLPAVFASAAITGTGFIFVQVGVQTLTASVASGAARTRNINLYALVVSTADFIGPVAAGFSIDHAGHVDTYLYLALMSSTAFIGLYFMAERFPPGAGRANDASHHRMMDLLRVPDLRRVFIASAVVMTGLDLFQLYLPLYAHDVGLSASAIGLVLGAFALAGFVTRAIMPYTVNRIGEERTLLWSIVGSALTFPLIPLVQNGYALGAISFMLGLGLALGQPLTVILAYNYSPQGRSGETIGLRIAINNSMHVMVPTAFGGMGSLMGIAPVFWMSAAVLGVGAWLSRRQIA
ncbi:MAG: MFS transporter [Pseudomonadota bacterium]